MSFAHYEIQKAIYDQLTGDATLMASISGVYDFVPDGAEFPYVTLGDSRMEDDSTVTRSAFRQHLTLHIHSRARGRKEVMDVMEKIHDALHGTTPEAEGHSMIDVRFTGSAVAQERDGLTFHGRMQFSILAEAD